MVTSSIDDLFRQKSLQEIHGILKQTRTDVEAKKKELRELVGDHYRSVLESSDHIRAMSDCAAKVSTGSQRVEELIASMRELASNPPVASQEPVLTEEDKAEAEEADVEYRLGLRVMELLELPEAVRGMLGDHAFARAARATVVEAAALQQEVDQLLNCTASKSSTAPGFDLQGLVRQQASAFRGLPRQVASGCIDAFGAAALTPAGAAEAFVAHLLLDEGARPGQLLGRFVQRRAELLRDILDGTAAAFSGGGMLDGSAQRLIAAAMAFEGTIVLASGLSSSGPGGAVPPLLAAAMQRMDAGGVQEGLGGPAAASLRRRVEMIAASLASPGVGSGSLAGDLSRLGTSLVHDWAPEDAASGSSRSLALRFRRLVAGGDSCPKGGASAGAQRSCAQLGELQELFSERLLTYRRSLAEGVGLGAAPEDWAAVWAAACGLFCPGRAAPRDALAIIGACIESTCAEVVQERIGELQLVLMPENAEDQSGPSRAGTAATDSTGGDDEGDDAGRRREELAEIRRHSQGRVIRFDEQLGEVLADVAHIARGGEMPAVVTAALLSALKGRLDAACDAVQLPQVQPAWPRPADVATASAPSWTRQRSAARAALALEALLIAAAGDSAEALSQLGTALKAGASSGDSGLAAQSEDIIKLLKKRSEEAYCVRATAWARLSVVPNSDASALSFFWRLAEDEAQGQKFETL
ncbi:unnamed protein product [Polarella glacialis]|uniref:Conserved oligomeric Golgi complex subunit 1 n=1 Tax=Polarella glacialis TaxID=89957 RepID=A0A813DSJ5_POLGL|nr:unnamed protein product [Polarella glacialis]